MKIKDLKNLRENVPKYRAKPKTIDGIYFASTKEANRYKELKLLTRAGIIHGLRTQVSFTLEINKVHICRYVADFVYFENGEKVVEDVKGFITPSYRLKKKLMKAIHGIIIKET